MISLKLLIDILGGSKALFQPIGGWSIDLKAEG